MMMTTILTHLQEVGGQLEVLDRDKDLLLGVKLALQIMTKMTLKA